MQPSLIFPKTFIFLHAKAKQPYDLGLACGELLHSIHSLVSYHLRHSADYKNNPTNRSIDTTDFTQAIDSYLFSMRKADGISNAFPDNVLDDRKQRTLFRKYHLKYTDAIEKSLKGEIAHAFEETFFDYDSDATQNFNKGMDFGLTGLAWRLYPSVNVVVEAGEEDWSTWLRVRCESLGKVSINRGLSAFDV